MLAILGLLGALFAGIAADAAMSMARQHDGPDDDTDDGNRAAGDVASESGALDLADGQPTGTDIIDFAGRPQVPPAGTIPAETAFDSSDADPAPVRNLALQGDDGADVLTGDRGDDSLSGGAGGDHIAGKDGDDLADGGEGDDHLYGGPGQDTVFGGSGHDVADGEDGADVIHGGAGDDLLRGHEGDDLLSGDAGNDTLLGGGGNDTLSADDGDDWLAGGDGDDVLNAGTGKDTLDGGSGQDTIWGLERDGPGGDAGYLNGGDGDDLLMIGAADHAHGGAGADTFVLGDWIDNARFATIADFDAAEDEIVVVYDPASHPEPMITVEVSEGSADATVLLDGMPLALVANGAGIDPAMIRLVSSQQIAA